GEDVAAAIAAALRVRQGPSTGLADALVAATRGEHRLLLLDGCEHVLDHLDPLVRRLLASAPQPRVLATTRIRFAAPGARLSRGRPLEPHPAPELFLVRASLVPGLGLGYGTRSRSNRGRDTGRA